MERSNAKIEHRAGPSLLAFQDPLFTEIGASPERTSALCCNFDRYGSFLQKLAHSPAHRGSYQAQWLRELNQLDAHQDSGVDLNLTAPWARLSGCMGDMGIRGELWTTVLKPSVSGGSSLMARRFTPNVRHHGFPTVLHYLLPDMDLGFEWQVGAGLATTIVLPPP